MVCLHKSQYSTTNEQKDNKCIITNLRKIELDIKEIIKEIKNASPDTFQTYD
jgi:hypothetical protein